MSKPKGPSVTFKGVITPGLGKVQGGYQGPRGNLGTPPTGSGGSGGGGDGGGGGSKK